MRTAPMQPEQVLTEKALVADVADQYGGAVLMRRLAVEAVIGLLVKDRVAVLVAAHVLAHSAARGVAVVAVRVFLVSLCAALAEK